ncbi:MAG: bifunctional glutamate N-acetyltransferase/amino-acid acetyltransferase ArgJ, partial [Endomicrobiia bacterium]|nr:bifunctional glutamate N-acetyltransferase/amino-acid acetyltransferase ArgJ [Endomicrobiia bacterium]
AGTRCGIKKKNKKDIALFYSDRPCAAAGVFTQNAFKAAPVTVSKSRVGGQCRAIIANSGNANACTGERGIKDARATCRKIATALGIKPAEVLVASTGVIGQFLPMSNIRRGVKILAAKVKKGLGDPASAAEAIMTTDTFPKTASASFSAGGKTSTIWACAKGSGMIAPNMATMLSFILTDAAATKAALSSALKAAVAVSFNRLTVDSDTSTNDTVLILSNGAAGNRPIKKGGRDFAVFCAALEKLCARLAETLASDGEGATKLIIVNVAGARNETDAARAAKCVAESPLVKTAVYGRDANWGRVVAALGRSGAAVEPAKTAVAFGGLSVFKRGRPSGFSESAAAKILSSKKVEINIDMGIAKGAARYFTCDFSEGYVKVNAAYRT